MLSLKKIIANPNFYLDNLNKRNKNYEKEIFEITSLAKEKKNLDVKIENLNLKIKDLSKNYQNNKNILNDTKKELEKNKSLLTETNEKIFNLLSTLPNILDDSVNIGKNEDDNLQCYISTENLKKDDWKKPHWELLEKQTFLEEAVNIFGARYVIYQKDLAQLHRAVGNFFLDEAIKNNYIEIKTPVLLKKDSLYVTGQLPKFKEDLYDLNNQENFLSPTGEVQLVNLFANQLINKKILPINVCCQTSCFRKEAGAAGKDTRGLIRLHEFTKVELVKITTPETSFAELENLVQHSTKLLEKLGLDYRVVGLCSGDIGFSASKTYDIEVWMAGQKKFREISSCSNCLDFQSLRGKIRYKNENGESIFVHTLNGSGLAVDRTVAAILENYQTQDNKILVPKVLQKYMENKKFFYF